MNVTSKVIINKVFYNYCGSVHKNLLQLHEETEMRAKLITRWPCFELFVRNSRIFEMS